MEAKAITKYLKIGPRKMVGLTKLVRSKDVLVAKTILLRSPKKGARLIEKTLNSAIANAKNKNMNEKNLFIEKIFADQGPTLKRFIPWSRGVAKPIRKRMTHLTIVLKEKETPSDTREEKKESVKDKSANKTKEEEHNNKKVEEKDNIKSKDKE